MLLSRSQSRLFAAVFAAAILILSIVATLMITRGWANDNVQDQVDQQETERREAMPTFSEQGDSEQD